MNKFLVSVVMSVCNGDKYLPEAIESILNQTYTNFEFIIVNDGSNDQSANIINKYKTLDKRIILLDRQNNEGLPYSLNEAINIARGKYIARMDADDVSATNRLEKQLAYLESNLDIDILGGQIAIMDKNGIQLGDIRKRPLSYEEIIITAKFSCPMNHPTYIVKNEVYKKLSGYRTIFTYAQDYDFILRAIDKGFIAENMPDVLLYYRELFGDRPSVKTQKQLFLTRYALKLHKERKANGETHKTLSKIDNFSAKHNNLFSFTWQLRHKLLRSKLGRNLSGALMLVVSIMHYEVFCDTLRNVRNALRKKL